MTANAVWMPKTLLAEMVDELRAMGDIAGVLLRSHAQTPRDHRVGITRPPRPASIFNYHFAGLTRPVLNGCDGIRGFGVLNFIYSQVGRREGLLRTRRNYSQLPIKKNGAQK